MGTIRKYAPEERVLRFCRSVQTQILPLVEDGSDDRRMTDAQKRDAVYAVLQCEPIIIDAKILELCLDRRSKWFGRASPMELHRMAQDLHYAIYPNPDIKARKRAEGENQFELNFEWSVDGDGQAVAQLAEAAE